MARTSARQAIALAVIAVAEMGGTILLSKSDADRFEGHSFSIRKAIVTDYTLACQSGSYVIERPFYGSWRLNKLLPSTGQIKVGPTFFTTSAFADALRLVSEMALVRGAK